MAKKIVSDLIVSPKSIRQIPVSKEIKSKAPKDSTNYREKYHIPNVRGNRKPLNPKFVIWMLAIICLAALFFGISLLFSSATIQVTPRVQEITFNNETYIAKLSPTATSDLPFEILTITKEASEVVSATAEKDVSQKASGIIVVYNNYSSSPQRLINNTRFESADGKIYRLNSSVVVPGTKTVEGKTVPGSIEATIFADEPGESFNQKVIDLKGDFKVPGFKGSPRYESFYGRLKGDLTGGFVGKQKIVEESVRKTNQELLKVDLKEQLLKELYAIKPENYLVFTDGYNLDYEIKPDSEADSKVKITVVGNLHAVIFNNLKLSKYIGLKKIENFDSLPTELVPSEDLTITFNGTDESAFWKNNSLNLKLNGRANIKWVYDAEMLKNDLAGKKESDLKTILLKYQNSVSAIQVVFRPVWTRYFPDNLSKIKVEEKSLTK